MITIGTFSQTILLSHNTELSRIRVRVINGDFFTSSPQNFNVKKQALIRPLQIYLFDGVSLGVRNYLNFNDNFIECPEKIFGCQLDPRGNEIQVFFEERIEGDRPATLQDIADLFSVADLLESMMIPETYTIRLLNVPATSGKSLSFASIPFDNFKIIGLLADKITDNTQRDIDIEIFYQGNFINQYRINQENPLFPEFSLDKDYSLVVKPRRNLDACSLSFEKTNLVGIEIQP